MKPAIVVGVKQWEMQPMIMQLPRDIPLLLHTTTTAYIHFIAISRLTLNITAFAPKQSPLPRQYNHRPKSHIISLPYNPRTSQSPKTQGKNAPQHAGAL